MSARPTALAALQLGFALSPLGAAAAPKPNVLFIAIDDLNDYVGCMGGHPDAETPNIDRLAARGTLFANAHCQAPICGPSRASLMTGLLPSTSGIYGQISDGDIATASAATRRATALPDYLEAHGYRTSGCGKIYHRGDGAGTFDEFGHGTDFGPKPERRLNYDPAEHPDRSGTTQTDWGAYPESDAEMPDHRTADWVRRKILSLSAELASERKPFFLAAGLCRPHVPWHVPRAWYDRHPRTDIELPPYRADDWDDLPAISRRVNVAPMMPSMAWVEEHGHWPAILQAYLASTTFADHQVGRILEMLDASPFAENTYIILWSDHGYHLGEKGRFAKQSLWERSSRVPLIIAGPGLRGGQRCGAAVQLLDIYPTLIDLLGLTPNRQNEGRSLVPLLENPKARWPHVAITTYGRGNHALQSRRYRYIEYEDGEAELYDHREDPNEWDNLIGSAGSEKLVEKLRVHLPRHNAPNAKGSAHRFNEYFRETLK